MSKPERLIEKLQWIATVSELPDEGVTVMLFSPDASEPVWPGYFDEVTAHGYVWRSSDGGVIDNVTHWAEWPAGPMALKSAVKHGRSLKCRE